jgi:hypothetical protein
MNKKVDLRIKILQIKRVIKDNYLMLLILYLLIIYIIKIRKIKIDKMKIIKFTIIAIINKTIFKM